MKLSSTLSHDIWKTGFLNSAENVEWAPERALSKENLNAIREVLVLCKQPTQQNPHHPPKQP
jgi:hypothetical protein